MPCITAPPLCTAYPSGCASGLSMAGWELCTVCTVLSRASGKPKPCPYLGRKPGFLRHWCRAPPDPGLGKSSGAEKAAAPRSCTGPGKRTGTGPAAQPRAQASDNRRTSSCTAALPPSRAGPDARRQNARQAIASPGLPCRSPARCRIPGLQAVSGSPGPHPFRAGCEYRPAPG